MQFLGYNILNLVLAHRMVFYAQTVQEIGKRSSTEEEPKYYECSYVDELFVDDAPDDDKYSVCFKNDCWSSQLTDDSRVHFDNLFNEFRSAVAAGICSRCKTGITYSNMFETHFHWYLEYLAKFYHFEFGCKLQMKKQKLPAYKLPRLDRSYSYGIFHPEHYQAFEFVSESFIVEDDEEQNETIGKIASYLKDDKFNFLDQWNIYGSALFYGCSIVVRDEVFSGTTGIGQNATSERVFYLSCVFAAKRDFYTTRGAVTNATCQATEKGSFVAPEWATISNLCSIDQRPIKALREEHPCQFYYPTTNNVFKRKCPRSVPYEWDVTKPPFTDTYGANVCFKNKNCVIVPYGGMLPTTTKPPDPNFASPPDPPNPETTVLVRLEIQFVTDENEHKFCFMLVCLLIIVLLSLGFTVSQIRKFNIENQKFNADAQQKNV